MSSSLKNLKATEVPVTTHDKLTLSHCLCLSVSHKAQWHASLTSNFESGCFSTDLSREKGEQIGAHRPSLVNKISLHFK